MMSGLKPRFPCCCVRSTVGSTKGCCIPPHTLTRRHYGATSVPCTSESVLAINKLGCGPITFDRLCHSCPLPGLSRAQEIGLRDAFSSHFTYTDFVPRTELVQGWSANARPPGFLAPLSPWFNRVGIVIRLHTCPHRAHSVQSQAPGHFFHLRSRVLDHLV